MLVHTNPLSMSTQTHYMLHKSASVYCGQWKILKRQCLSCEISEAGEGEGDASLWDR
jgi:hypothetical protein